MLAFLLLFALRSNSQMVAQEKFSVPDSVRNHLNKPAAVFYAITYLSDGLKIKGFIAIPDDGRQHSAVLFNRGGNESYSMLTRESFARKAGFLLDNGYIVAATQYRGSEGSEGKDEFGGGDVADVLNLVQALQVLQQVDTSRIALFGWSWGAINTYIALTRTSSIKAAVVGGGFANLLTLRSGRPLMDSLLYQKLIPGYGQTRNEDLLKQRSAFYLADKIAKTTPILILHGTADGNVPVSQSISLAQRFYEVRQPFRLILYEGGVHSLDQFRAEYEAEIIRWFNKYLKEGRPAPDLEPVFRR